MAEVEQFSVAEVLLIGPSPRNSSAKSLAISCHLPSSNTDTCASMSTRFSLEWWILVVIRPFDPYASRNACTRTDTGAYSLFLMGILTSSGSVAIPWTAWIKGSVIVAMPSVIEIADRIPPRHKTFRSGYLNRADAQRCACQHWAVRR